MESPPQSHSYRFGPFRLEPIERRLLRGDTPVTLTAKAFDLLVVLVENSGHLLEKEALMKRVWADAFVEEANLANNISLLRKVLNEGAAGEYIETVPKRGYRFRSDVAKFDGSYGDVAAMGSPVVSGVGQPAATAVAPSVESGSGAAVWSRRLIFLLAGLLVSAGVVWWASLGDRPVSNPRTVRFTIAPPPGTLLATTPQPLAPALSPDGTHLVFRVLRAGQPLLAIRAIDAIDSQILAGTEGARFPFWSPDGRDVAFFAGDKLKRISTSGGSVRTICDAAPGFGGTWSRDGLILFAPGDRGLFSVPATGGQRAPVTSLRQDEAFHQHPQFLPDGHRFLYFAAPDSVYLGSLDGGMPIRVLANSRMALYSPPGFLLFVEDGTLFARPFDPDRASFSGDAVALGDRVRTGGSTVAGRAVGGAAFSVSETGVLVYGTNAPVAVRFAWLDRAGRPSGSITALPFEQFLDPDLSPDGKRLAIANGPNGVWVVDLPTGYSSQITFDSAPVRRPIWSPDGHWLAFLSRQATGPAIYRKKVSGEPAEELLIGSEDLMPSDWTSSGIVYEVRNSGVWMVPIEGDRKARLLVPEAAISSPDATMSPDTRWLAYTADPSGRPEVFVQSTAATSAKWGISPEGGSLPRWRHDGKELFYLAADGNLMAARIEADATSLHPGIPQALFHTRLTTLSTALRFFDVAPDGQRFLIALPDDAKPTPSLVVVSNWLASLKP